MLDQIRAGEREPLHDLVRALTPMLWQVARAQGLDRSACEDIVQMTWLTLLRNLDSIRTPAALVGWLVTVTKREAWRARSAAARVEPLDSALGDDQPDPGPLPAEVVSADEQRAILWAAVRRLSQRCQQLLRVVAFAARPDYAEVSRALGMPVGSIGPTRGRCLARLRAALAADPRWSGP